MCIVYSYAHAVKLPGSTERKWTLITAKRLVTKPLMLCMCVFVCVLTCMSCDLAHRGGTKAGEGEVV